MRYATFSLQSDSTLRLGVVRGDRVIDAATLAAGGWPGAMPVTLLDLIRQGPAAWQRLADLASRPAADGAAGYAAADVRWHAPIPRPSKNVFCVGRNYAEHVAEGARARGEVAQIPQHTVFFTKAPTCVSGPFDEIRWRTSVTQKVDWEAELGVIIGKGGRDITKGAALGHVFGYTVINDVTARDLQKAHFQFFKGKSLDGFCPMGPVVVTADEFGDPQDKLVSCRVNGVVKQEQRTSEMIFPVDTIIEQLSAGLTLDAGDIIATGTPEGVGFGRNPPEFMNGGDVLETEVEGIGVMRNQMRSEP
jgi:2-keto-4-pentenoate hydratase/2-oxohepta-3-ene-1,7-dioic acid hydratase in catechol pathway